MNKYRKLPVVIEAVQFDGTLENWKEIQNWIHGEHVYGACVKSLTDNDIITNEGGIWVENNKIEINTLEGRMTATSGDFIICGINGEFYPCKPDIFWKTYEAVEE